MSFEPVYRSRSGADAMRPAAAERADEIAPGLWCSPGLSNSYLLTTHDGRVIGYKELLWKHRSELQPLGQARVRADHSATPVAAE